MDKIIGRDAELAKLARYNQSGKAEFIALYGRCRVGKTSLIRYFFKDKFDFYASGVLEGDKEDQKSAFLGALTKYGYEGPTHKNWAGKPSRLSDLSNSNNLLSHQYQICLIIKAQ